MAAPIIDFARRAARTTHIPPGRPQRRWSVQFLGTITDEMTGESRPVRMRLSIGRDDDLAWEAIRANGDRFVGSRVAGSRQVVARSMLGFIFGQVVADIVRDEEAG